MMHSFNNGNNHGYESSDNSSAFFSPARGRRASLHQATPEGNDDSLPRLQDTSWLGANVSAIQSDDDDDEENDLTIAPYHKALNESSFVGATESTSLLGGGRKGQNRWNLHPLWDNQDPFALEQKRIGHRKSSVYRLGLLVVAISGILLAVIGLHDFYLWYLSVRQARELVFSVAWGIPWLSPSDRTLLRFGGFCPLRFVEGEYFRVVTSWFLSSSVIEWALTAWGWWYVKYLPVEMVWPLYVMSCATGQLWMAAFDLEGVSGSTSWGTSGILCAIGVSRPERRFILFSFTICLVVINLLEPNSSVYGAIGASFFGWSFAGGGFTNTLSPRHKDHAGSKNQNFNFFAALAVITLWLLPILFVLLSNDRS